MVWRKFDPRDVNTYPNSDGYNIYLVWMGGYYEICMWDRLDHFWSDKTEGEKNNITRYAILPTAPNDQPRWSWGDGLSEGRPELHGPSNMGVGMIADGLTSRFVNIENMELDNAWKEFDQQDISTHPKDEDYNIYLVYMLEGYEICMWNRAEHNWWHRDLGTMNNITHYMTLPPSPEGEPRWSEGRGLSDALNTDQTDNG